MKLRLDADVLDAYRKTGDGWQTADQFGFAEGEEVEGRVREGRPLRLDRDELDFL